MSGDRTPVLLEFSTGSSDEWLRMIVRGDTQTEPPPAIQRVVVQGFKEAYRVYVALASLKRTRNKPFGGATYRRL